VAFCDDGIVRVEAGFAEPAKRIARGLRVMPDVIEAQHSIEKAASRRDYRGRTGPEIAALSLPVAE
jgi:hypothetical protein